MSSSTLADLFATANVAPRPAAWAGCDVAKATFDAAVGLPAEDGQPPDARNFPVKTFPRAPEGVAAFLAWADGLLAAAGDEPRALRVVMEATGSYSAELAVWMADARPALGPAVVNPCTAHAFAASLDPRARTDKTDARALARYGLERRPAAHEPLSPEQAELRSLSRYRLTVIETRVAEEHRAAEPNASPFVVKTLKAHIQKLRRTEAAIEKQMKKVLAKMADLARDGETLQTIHGVGFITAVTVLAELGDLRRFEKARQLTAFSGVTPRIKESGATVAKRPRLCKQGSSWARRALYMAALTVVRGDSDLADAYKRLVARGKPKKAALGVVMRKLLVVMRAIVISGKPYQNHHRPACGKPGAKPGEKSRPGAPLRP